MILPKSKAALARALALALLATDPRHAANANSDGNGPRNVLGEPLKACSQAGMAKTGVDRSGKCVDQAGDTGSHHICINLNSTSSDGRNFCEVTGQDNWCAESMPCQEGGGDCPVERWCVCQWAFEGYIKKAGGCDSIQEIKCDAVNIKALEAYQANTTAHGEALSCLQTKCNLDDGEFRQASVER